MNTVDAMARLGAALALAFALHGTPAEAQQAEPLPSWNDGPAKAAILDFVHATRDPASPDFVAPGARLVAVTGYGQDGDRQRARAAGFDRHLVKPVTWDGLTEALHA